MFFILQIPDPTGKRKPRVLGIVEDPSARFDWQGDDRPRIPKQV